MPATYEKIATTTLGSAAASITFSSIAASWTDLKLVFNFRSTTGLCIAGLRFNNDSGTNYSNTILTGDGTSATSSRYTNGTNLGNQSGFLNTNVWGMLDFDIFSYSGSTFKTCLYTKSYDANGSGYVMKEVGLWRSTSAINRIDLFSGANQFATGSIATLYGILKA